jgi:hypothetical protein
MIQGRYADFIYLKCGQSIHFFQLSGFKHVIVVPAEL